MKGLLFSAAVVCVGLSAGAQTGGVQPATQLTVDGATTLRFEGTQTFEVGSGAAVLNNGTIVFGTQATLTEAPGSPIYGSGIETTERNHTVPLSGIDPAGLGLRINTISAPGLTKITRGHTAFIDNGGQAGLLRWYDVDAATNTGLSADISFSYDLTELNSMIETDLLLHVRDAGSVWHYLPPSTVDVGNAEVIATGLDSLGTYTCFDDMSTGQNGDLVISDLLLLPTIATEEVTLIADHRPERVEVFASDGRRVLYVQPSSARTVISVHALASGRYVVLVDGSTALSFVKP